MHWFLIVDNSSSRPSITGPKHDRERHNVGIEYEVLLEETLREMGESIVFFFYTL